MKVDDILGNRARASQGRIIAVAAITGLLFLFYFRHSIASLLDVWQTPEYSYGYLVFPIAAILAINKLAERRPSLQRSRWGIAVIALGLAMQAGIELTGRLTMPQYSIIVTLVGLCMVFFGRDVTATIKWPLFYLVFCIPLPEIAYEALSAKLQIVSTTIGVDMLDVIGVPAYQEGNVIDLSQFKLQVVEACSGLRYLFPLTSFSFLLAYAMRAGWAKRTIVLLSSIPISVLMNSLRIAAIGVTVDLWGPKMAEGLLHDFEGWTVFLLCVAILLVEVYLLNRIGRGKGAVSLDLFRFSKGPYWRGTFAGSAGQGAPIAALSLMAVFSLAMAASLLSPKPEVLPAHKLLADYPRDLGDWHGRGGQLTDQVLQILKPTDYLLTDYSDGAESANLYVAFYDSQRNAAPHSPEICIPGGGWEIVSLSLLDLDVPGAPKGAKIKRVLIQHGEMRQIVYFWLVERGRVVTNDWAARWYLFIDPIRYGRTDGALIRAITPLARGEDEASGDARLMGFLQLALPRLGEFIPLQPVDASN